MAHNKWEKIHCGEEALKKTERKRFYANRLQIQWPPCDAAITTCDGGGPGLAPL